MVQMSDDMQQLRTTTEELLLGSAETVVVGVFRPSLFAGDVSEGAVLIEAIRAGVKDFLRRPVSSNDLAALFDRLGKQAVGGGAARGRVVSFISSKGGVGKTTLAVNVAVGLAMRRPERVLLIDGALQIGACAAMLDLHPRTTLMDAVRQRARLDETLVRELTTPHASGLAVLAAPSDPVDAAEIDDETLSRLITLARRAYDYVVVDTFPLLDRNGMAVLDLSDRAYVVVENVVPTLLGAAKFLELLDGLNFDASRQRVVINRYTTAPGCPRAADVALRLRRPVAFRVPFDRRWVTAANTGRPFALSATRFSASGRALRRLVADVETTSAADAAAAAGQSAANERTVDAAGDER